MSYYKQIMTAPEGLRVVYQDGAGYEVESRRVVALGLTEFDTVDPLVLEDGKISVPKGSGIHSSWSLSLQ